MRKIERTYMFRQSTIDWIDSKAEEEGAEKSEVAERAIRFYATMLMQENGWEDEHWKDNVDDAFERNL